MCQGRCVELLRGGDERFSSFGVGKPVALVRIKMLECDVWWSVGRCWSVMCGGQWEGVGV